MNEEFTALLYRRALIVAFETKPHWSITDLGAHCHASRRAAYRWVSGEAAVNVAAVLTGPPGFVRAFLQAVFVEMDQPLQVVRRYPAAVNDTTRLAA